MTEGRVVGEVVLPGGPAWQAGAMCSRSPRRCRRVPRGARAAAWRGGARYTDQIEIMGETRTDIRPHPGRKLSIDSHRGSLLVVESGLRDWPEDASHYFLQGAEDERRRIGVTLPRRQSWSRDEWSMMTRF